jgi:hypothetical protein
MKVRTRLEKDWTETGHRGDNQKVRPSLKSVTGRINNKKATPGVAFESMHFDQITGT